MAKIQCYWRFTRQAAVTVNSIIAVTSHERFGVSYQSPINSLFTNLFRLTLKNTKRPVSIFISLRTHGAISCFFRTPIYHMMCSRYYQSFSYLIMPDCRCYRLCSINITYLLTGRVHPMNYEVLLNWPFLCMSRYDVETLAALLAPWKGKP